MCLFSSCKLLIVAAASAFMAARSTSVNGEGLLCDGPLKGVGTSGGLLGGSVGGGLRCSGADAELLQLQLRMDACNIMRFMGGGIRGGLFRGGVGDSMSSIGVCAELRGGLLRLPGSP